VAELIQPSPERRRRLAAIAAAHHEWALQQLQRDDVPFRPRGNDSDYNLHHLDIEADGQAEDDLQAAVQRHLRTS
jgi:molybdopterin-guanine dinucleotide biosynthesis protein